MIIITIQSIYFNDLPGFGSAWKESTSSAWRKMPSASAKRSARSKAWP